MLIIKKNPTQLLKYPNLLINCFCSFACFSTLKCILPFLSHDFRHVFRAGAISLVHHGSIYTNVAPSNKPHLLWFKRDWNLNQAQLYFQYYCFGFTLKLTYQWETKRTRENGWQHYTFLSNCTKQSTNVSRVEYNIIYVL